MTLILFGVLLSLPISGIYYLAHAKKSPQAQEILKNFEEAASSKGLAITNPKLEEVILKCCENREDAINVIEEAGFTFQSQVLDPVKLNKHWNTENESYDEFLFAKKRSFKPNLKNTFSEYQILLFIKGNKVSRIWSRVDKAMP